MLDPRDKPGSWTDRMKDSYEAARYRLTQHVTWANTLTEQLENAAATRSALTPPRDRLRAARAAIRS